MGVDDLSETNEQKMDELLSLMRSVVPDPEGMNDAGRIGFVYKYDYDPTETYEKLDVVLFGPSLWTPKQNTTGNAPPDQSQAGQENVKENDFWRIFLPGAPSGDYIKRTDIAQAPTETSEGKLGISKPDGKTILIDENGVLSGGSLDFAGTEEELAQKMSEEDMEGTTVFLKDAEWSGSGGGSFSKPDAELSETSENTVMNKAVAAGINEVKAMRASETEYGMVKVTSARDVTDLSSGQAICATENNANIDGTLRNAIKLLENKTERLNTIYNKRYVGDNAEKMIESVIDDIFSNYGNGAHIIIGGWTGKGSIVIYAGKFSDFVSCLVLHGTKIYLGCKNGSTISVSSINTTDLYSS